MLEISYKRILLIALPVMFGTFVQSLIGIIDGAFVSKLGNISYNAVGNGSMIYIALFMLLKGLADGTQITIARQLGETKISSIGQTLFNSQVIQLFLTLLFLTALYTLSAPLIKAIVSSKPTASAMNDFINYRGWGLVFSGIQVSLAAFFIGIGKTRIIITSTCILLLSNVFLDYAMVFGKFGFPEMGIKGAALASSIAEAICCIYLFWILIRLEKYRQFNYNLKQSFDKKISWALVKLSTPIMFQGLISLTTWLVFFTLIEHMGPQDLEVAHNIRYMYFLAFVPIFGFSSTARTYVSNLVGRSERHLIVGTQLKIALLALISILAIFHGAFLYPEVLISAVNHNPNISSEVLQNSANALRFVSGSIVLYAVGSIPLNAIGALGKTQIAFYIEITAISLYLIACYYFFKVWHWNIIQVWWVEYIYFGVLTLFSVAYLFLFRKRLGLVDKKIVC